MGRDGNKRQEDVIEQEHVQIKKKRELFGYKFNNNKKDLIGISLSGGGIRSATFSLGVLEILKDCGILKRVDYLSTVSGGGFVGGWLIANCFREEKRNSEISNLECKNNGKPSHWLESNSDWNDSIDHLRRFSNYLAPTVGVFSPDTWTMSMIWFRNMFLVQTLLVLLLGISLLIPTISLPFLFHQIGPLTSRGIISLFYFFSIFFISLNQYLIARTEKNGGTPNDLESNFSFGQKEVLLFIITPLIIGCFSFAGDIIYGIYLIDCDSDGKCFYGDFFIKWGNYISSSLIFMLASYWIISLSCSRHSIHSFIISLLSPIPAVVFIYTAFCSLIILLKKATILYKIEITWEYLVFIIPIIIYLKSMAVALLIGTQGRASSESSREWWSRLAAWLSIFGAIWTIMGVVSVYGRCIIEFALKGGWPNLLVFATWIGVTASGLWLGKERITKEEGYSYSQAIVKLLNIIAKLAPYVFIAGSMLLISSLLDLTLNFINNQWFGATRIENSVSNEAVILVLFLMICSLLLFGYRFDINEFSLNSFYRYRLTRCYLGASKYVQKERTPHKFTGFDESDDLKLSDLGYRRTLPMAWPLHIINCALNLGGSRDLALHTRHSASFVITPYFSGTSYASKNKQGEKEEIGFKNIDALEMHEPMTLGKAISISGAAASPNMGFRTSPIIASLLTIFNMRLGCWFPNPREHIKSTSPAFSPWYLMRELFGSANEESDFLMVSDGGHFENLGTYELVRRNCKLIIAIDSECDLDMKFEGIGNLIRMCEVDFGAKINIRLDEISSRGSTGKCFSIGKILYKDGSDGIFIYVKASLCECDDAAVLQYASANEEFPHEPTGNQFYNEHQFESYRRLGKGIARKIFDINGISDIIKYAEDKYIEQLNKSGRIIVG